MRERRRGGIVGPLILIAIGVIFLLQQLGLVASDIWLRLIGLWPLILIAVGVDLVMAAIAGRSWLGALASLVLVALVFGAGILLLARGSLPAVGGRAFSSESISQPAGGARSAQLDIEMGDGQLRLTSGLETASLVSGTVQVRSGSGRLTQDYRLDGDVARFTLQDKGDNWMTPGWGAQRLWDLQLSQGLPLRLVAKVGVGDLRLGGLGLNLSYLDAESGVGQVRVTLPGHGNYSATVHAGIGDVLVYVPSSLAARIHAHAGLGSAKVEGNYSKPGDEEWVSPGYDTATDRVDLTLDSGIGSVRVVQGSGV
jgi:hypothetical protein